MRVAFPHMGHIWVPLKTIFQELGVECVIPPAPTQRTLTLATRYAPEGLCLPFKLTLGTFMEALDLGADTLLQAGGAGICRLGRYAQTQEHILKELGYHFNMITLGVSERKLQGLLLLFKKVSGDASWPRILSAFRFGIAKLNAIDEIEKQVHWVRPREQERGTTTRLFKEAIASIDEAASSKELSQRKEEYKERLHQVPLVLNGEPLLVGVMGEFYVVLEPFTNLDIEIELGKLGVEVKRSIFISEWTKFTLFLNPLGINEKARLQRAARPYLARDVGGDGWETVGEKVLHAHHFDGLVHLAPFTCMPETVAMNILPSIKEDIPVLTIMCDEQMGKAGLITRLEAFTDLLKRRRAKKLVHR